MTVNEFARKYDIPHNLAYRASFKTATRKVNPYYIHDIPEHELAEETYKILSRSAKDHKEKAERYSMLAEKLKP